MWNGEKSTDIHLNSSSLTKKDNLEDGFYEPDANKITGVSNFPGTLELLVKKNGQISANGPFLHPGYRRYTGDSIKNEEFIFLVTKFMEKMSPLRNKFKKRCYEEVISKIYTPSDEAYALVVLWSQGKLWENQKIDKENDLKVRTKKDNCLSFKGRGWSKDEIKLYRKVVDEVKDRRKEETSINLERHLLDLWRRETQGSRQQVTSAQRERFLPEVNDIAGIPLQAFLNGMREV